MSKRISKVDNIKYALSGNDRYIASVDPGETFVVECAINANDGTIRHLGQQLTEADVTFPFVNGATGPIEVRGSKAGDMLKVEIVNMELDKLGFTALWPGIGMFPDWVRRKEFGRQTRVVEVKDGRVHWNDHLKLPVKPMIGVLGVAPVHGAVLTIDNGPHGGNLDVQEITTGNTVMFRVNKDGTHLFMGDCHAIQGDGECNSKRRHTSARSAARGPLKMPCVSHSRKWCTGWKTSGRFRPPKDTCFWVRLPRRDAPRWSIRSTLTSARSIRACSPVTSDESHCPHPEHPNLSPVLLSRSA